MTSERARRPIERFEVFVASLVLALAALGLTLLPITSEPCVKALVAAVGSTGITGLSEAGTYEAAEAVRVFVIDADAPALPRTLEGSPAFDEGAVSHLVDVRNVLIPTRWLTLVLGLLSVAWLAARVRRVTGRRVVAAGLCGAGVTLGICAVLAVAIGALDFGAFFTWFHGLFFEAGTWTFPSSALLIRVFPTAFWVSAGALWGVLALMSGALMFIVGRRLGFTVGNYGV